MRLENGFLRQLAGSCRVRAGQSVVTAVSGGPDSMALLHLLAAARKNLRLDLTAVWIDHGLRPLETPQEEKIVAAATERLGIPLLSRRAAVADHARTRRLSIEAAARELRYAVLREAAYSCGAELTAVGHTADDQAEELLLRLLRGSGRKGMAGMSMRNGGIIRPLLHFRKQELLGWLERRGIAFCYDSSNSERKFLRNRVRHELLPFLEEHFEPGIRNALLKTADSLAADEDLLEQLTDKAWRQTVHEEDGLLKLLRDPFRSLHIALQRRVIEQLLWRLDSRADYAQILLLAEAALQGRNRSELHLSGGLRAGIFADWVEFSYPAGRRGWRGRLLPAPNQAPSVAPPAPRLRQKPS